MLDIKFLRTNFEEVKAKLQHRGEDLTDFGRLKNLIREEESYLFKLKN